MNEESPQEKPEGREPEFHGHLLVVVFREEIGLRYVDSVEKEIRQRGIGPWDKLVEKYPGISIRRLYRSLTPERAEEMNRLALERDKDYRPYNFLRVFLIHCPPGVDAPALTKELSTWPAVEQAYVPPRFAPASIPSPSSNPEYENQGYLKPAPEGIDAKYAWERSGGSGEFVIGADLEFWYDKDHEDLKGQPIENPFEWKDSFISMIQDDTVRNDYINHGTMTLGVLCASNNDLGVIGIVPKIGHDVPNLGKVGKLYFLSLRPTDEPHLADQIIEAIARLPSGSVLLIELEGFWGDYDGAPVEVDPQVREAITLATAEGVTVIEPAGNDGFDLDSYVCPESKKYVLNRHIPEDFKDSGAIMVGACTNGVPHLYYPANYGSRVDCYAWGFNVLTTCYPGSTYCGYGGTSAAGAIIAGAALSLQSIAQTKPSGYLKPAVLRAYLSNSSYGTRVYHKSPSEPPMGYMPDLKPIVHLIADLNGTRIAPPTHTVQFVGIYAGYTVWRAASFEVDSIKKIHLGIKAGSGPVPPFAPWGYAVSGSVYPGETTCEIGPTLGPTTVRFWFSFTVPPELGGEYPPSYDSPVTFVCSETGQEFPIALTAKVEGLPYIAFLLTLDKSGSMNGPAGDTGVTKIKALRDALAAFVELVPTAYHYEDNYYPGDYVGIVSFGAEASRDKKVKHFDEERKATEEMLEFVDDFDALPYSDKLSKTAIGKALLTATEMLDDESVEAYYTRSIVVLTDGKENVRPFIEEVMGDVTDRMDRIYAIGLGKESQVNTKALNQLTESVGGYALLTGALTVDTEDYFRLTKYFIQILVDLTGQDVSADPAGRILPDQEIRIPFTLSDADIKAEVVLLLERPVIELELETPEGTVIASDTPGVFRGQGPKVQFCRMGLPIQTPEGEAHAGTWHARLKSEETGGTYMHVAETDVHSGSVGDTHRQAPKATGVRYSLSVHTTSNLRLNARLHQGSFLPGDAFRVRASPEEFGVPLRSSPELKAHVRRPDGTATTIGLHQDEPGIFDAEIPTPIPGVYQVRLSAAGRTYAGHPFTREKLLTAAVWPGGEDTPAVEVEEPTDKQWIVGLLIAIVVLLFLLLLTVLF